MSMLVSMLSPGVKILQRLDISARLWVMGLLTLAPLIVLVAWQVLQAYSSQGSLSAATLASVVGLLLVIYIAAAFKRSVTEPVTALERIARSNAQGDLSRTVLVPGSDELARAGQSLESMNENFSGLVGTIRNQAVHVAQAGSSLSNNMGELAQRTEAQAANLQQASASIHSLSDTAQATALRSQEVDQLTRRVRTEAEAGSQAMDVAVAAINEIQQSSKRMGEIVSVIDGIAFQTNILALNAAVEAARAGEAGRGFAVVATEVRVLAQRSASSAKEIRSLIAHAIEQVEVGVARIGTVTGNLRTVVSGIKEVAQGLEGISKASGQQSSTLSEISTAIRDLDNITQRNAAMVDQALQATMGLSDGASHLSESVAGIRLRRGTSDEAFAMVQRASALIQRVGLQAASTQFHDQNGAFRDRDLYIFVFNRDGVYDVFGSTPQRVGSTVYETAGLDGDHVLREGFATAERGGGWIEYEVINPVTRVVDIKTSYILPLSGDRILGCGVFKPKGGFSLAAGG